MVDCRLNPSRPHRIGQSLALTGSPCRNGRAPVCSLRHVLDVGRQADPSVLAFFVDREAWLGKGGVGECADRNDYAVSSTFYFVVDCCAASGAEAECGSASLISDTDVLPGLTLDRYALLVKASLSTKHTPGSTLTCKTVADRDTNWVFSCRRCQLPAATGGDSCFHDRRPRLRACWRPTSKLSGRHRRGAAKRNVRMNVRASTSHAGRSARAQGWASRGLHPQGLLAR